MSKHWTKKGWAALSAYERKRAIRERADEIMRQTKLGSLMTIPEAMAIATRDIKKSFR